MNEASRAPSKGESGGRICVQDGELAPEVYEAIESVQIAKTRAGPFKIEPARQLELVTYRWWRRRGA